METRVKRHAALVISGPLPDEELNWTNDDGTQVTLIELDGRPVTARELQLIRTSRRGVTMLEDGTLRMTFGDGRVLISKDEGETWVPATA